MKKLIILACFTLVGKMGFPQTGLINSGGLPMLYFSGEKSAKLVESYKREGYLLSKAYDSYEEGNLKMTKRYLEQSEDKEGVSAAFYFLLGQYFFVLHEFDYAERYWKRGYNKKSCWECQEKVAMLTGNTKGILMVSKEAFNPVASEPNAETISSQETDDVKNKPIVESVDDKIPFNTHKYPNRYALVIGNEDYKHYQSSLGVEQNVKFARNDAIVFAKYLTETLGFLENQVFVLTDATSGQMGRELDRLTELAKLDPNSEIVFYYAGHGFPDFNTKQGYIIPIDISASYLSDAISLRDLYAKLASSNASKILVFLDACFSGGGRGEDGLLASRTVKIKPKGDILEGNIIAFTATNGDQASLPCLNEPHGLFTYCLLNKFKNSKGDFTLEELRCHLELELPKASLLENGLKQSPQVLTAPDLNDSWLEWKF